MFLKKRENTGIEKNTAYLLRHAHLSPYLCHTNCQKIFQTHINNDP